MWAISNPVTGLIATQTQAVVQVTSLSSQVALCRRRPRFPFALAFALGFSFSLALGFALAFAARTFATRAFGFVLVEPSRLGQVCQTLACYRQGICNGCQATSISILGSFSSLFSFSRIGIAIVLLIILDVVVVLSMLRALFDLGLLLLKVVLLVLGEVSRGVPSFARLDRFLSNSTLSSCSTTIRQTCDGQPSRVLDLDGIQHCPHLVLIASCKEKRWSASLIKPQAIQKLDHPWLFRVLRHLVVTELQLQEPESTNESRDAFALQSANALVLPDDTTLSEKRSFSKGFIQVRQQQLDAILGVVAAVGHFRKLQLSFSSKLFTSSQGHLVLRQELIHNETPAKKLLLVVPQAIGILIDIPIKGRCRRNCTRTPTLASILLCHTACLATASGFRSARATGPTRSMWPGSRRLVTVSKAVNSCSIQRTRARCAWLRLFRFGIGKVVTWSMLAETQNGASSFGGAPHFIIEVLLLCHVILQRNIWIKSKVSHLHERSQWSTSGYRYQCNC